MFEEIHPFYEPWDPYIGAEYHPDRRPEPDDFDEYVKQAFKHFFIQILIIILTGILIMMCSCSSPKVIEQHHHHFSQVDSLAVQAQVESRLSGWSERMDSTYSQFLAQYHAEWQSHSDERETTTELITVTKDSLGCEIRTERRRTERTMSQQQQQTEQRLTRSFEVRLRAAIDSIGSLWQSRYDSLQSAVLREDSTYHLVRPAKDLTVWQRARLHLSAVILVLLALAALVWLIRKRVCWAKIIKKLR